MTDNHLESYSVLDGPRVMDSRCCMKEALFNILPTM
jgi:hypothetical protein